MGHRAEQASRGGRLPLTLLLIGAAAFLLLPATPALAANGTMTVVGLGDGDGEVTSGNQLGQWKGIPPIACAYDGETETQSGVCNDELSVEEGLEATFLHAQAGPGSEFAGWIVEKGGPIKSGCGLDVEGKPQSYCGPGAFPGQKPKFEVAAIFAASEAESTLTVTKQGTGTGTVKSAPAGIDCGSECEADFPVNELVTLTATADPGSEINAWTAGTCIEETEDTCTVRMDKAREVKATFASQAQTFQLTLTPEGTGTGTVTSEPAGINCGATCSHSFSAGEEVTLSAEAAVGSEFSGWSGCDSEPEGKCKVTMSAAREVKASFGEEEGPPSGPPLTLDVEAGEGTVVSNPAGLECTGAAPKSCTTESIAEGEEVTLTASPAPGYALLSWKHCDSGGVNGRQCTIHLDEAKEVGVRFAKVWALEGSKSGGPGILSTSPSAVSCGYGCEASTGFYRSGSVTVNQKPAKHFHFVEFTNGSGSASVCNGHDEAEGCTFTIAEDSAIEEVYAEDAKHTLTLSKEGGGQGLIKSKPANVNCGYACASAKAGFYASESPEVTVTLGKGTTQVTWTSGAGTCVEHATSCTVPMSSDQELVAKFE